jgi:F-type H+-transporting ATPase subunit epsilon
MHIEIITPDKKVYSGDITLVQVPGSKGSFEVLHNHAPIISTLDKGRVKINTSDKQTKYFQIDGGLIEVKDNEIILLAESLNEE